MANSIAGRCYQGANGSDTLIGRSASRFKIVSAGRRNQLVAAGKGNAAGPAAATEGGKRYARGREMMTRVDIPMVLSARTVPPCSFTMCLTMDKPNPVPPYWRLRALSTR
jgi:hypothetical protein